MPDKMTNHVNSCESCTGNWKHFSHLSKSELHLLNENRYEAYFKPGEIMIKQGSPATHALFMATGLAKVYIEGNSGKNFMLGIGSPGGLIMSPGSYSGAVHSYSVAAIMPVKACFVSIAIIKELARTNGDLAQGLIEDLSMKSHKSHLRMLSMAQKRMSGRLAEILLYFADEIFHHNEYDMVLSRQELGEMASMAKECVVRILREFEDSGIIHSNSARLKILDREKLLHISEKG